MRKPSPATAIALAGLVVALGGVAFAQIPSSDGTIHACYHKSTGSVRLVESPGDCRRNENATSWNQQGPSGGGRTISDNETVPYFGEVTVFNVPGFFSLTLLCYSGPTDFEATATVHNLQSAGDLNTWIAFEGANASFESIQAGQSDVTNITDQGWIFHFAGSGDRAASGPLHLRNTGSGCLVAGQATIS